MYLVWILFNTIDYSIMYRKVLLYVSSYERKGYHARTYQVYVHTRFSEQMNRMVFSIAIIKCHVSIYTRGLRRGGLTPGGGSAYARNG